ncbi:olfactory receptor 10A7-like [Candoia aspera]|uniref:olfactory receptor 10A7-like n=1 Tax=Candoia aspera TaxID=51853 RepID=UPI002FD87894
MNRRNKTSQMEFILIGFSNMPNAELLLFPLVLMMYIVTVSGNILIIVIVTIDSALQSSMYFFLKNLSFTEICFTLDTVPKMLINLLQKDKSISYVGCAIQMFGFFYFACIECLLLAAMAYDRYVAICKPLHYSTIMNRVFCHKLVGGLWVLGIPVSLMQAAWIFSFPFCGLKEINHFFCDVPPVLKLVCADTYLFEIQSTTSTFLFIIFPFMFILISYIHIIITILSMSSAQSRQKAFSTCSAHLIVVTLFYGSGSIVYLKPRSSYSSDVKKMLSLFYTIVIPMLNPIVYTLRNSEVKEALRRNLLWKVFAHAT